jgi:hypothetical protein
MVDNVFAMDRGIAVQAGLLAWFGGAQDPRACQDNQQRKKYFKDDAPPESTK